MRIELELEEKNEGGKLVCVWMHRSLNPSGQLPKGGRNKAGYTATPVACGWAGAIFESLDHLGRSSEVKNIK